MKRTYQFFKLVIFVLLFSCNNRKTENIRPKWEKGDIRNVTAKVVNRLIIKNDTSLNTTGYFTYKIHVVDKNSDSYILKISDRSKPQITYNGGNDTVNNQFKALMHACDQVPMHGFSYNIKTSLNGEILEIANWETVRDTLISITKKFIDTYKITSEEKQYFKRFAERKYAKKESIRDFLLDQVSDIFALYNTIISKDSAITSEVHVPDPSTGQKIKAKQTCKLLSIKNNLYVIEVAIDLNDRILLSKKDHRSNYFSNNSSKNSDVKIDDKTYYWNSNTGWLDSLNSFLQIKSDSFYWLFKKDIVIKK